MFFQLESFVDKAIFNSHSFNRINDFVTTQYVPTIFYPFYLNPCLDKTRIGCIMQDLVCKQKLLTEKLLQREFQVLVFPRFC